MPQVKVLHGPRLLHGNFFLFPPPTEMAPRKGKEKKEEQVISLGPQVAEGENVFGVCHIFASFNDTFVHVTDLSGKWVVCIYGLVFRRCGFFLIENILSRK